MDKKDTVNDDLISTVMLPRMVTSLISGHHTYETCIFFYSLDDDHYFSEVVETYGDADAAMAGHNEWVANMKSGKVSWRNFRD